MDWEKLFRRYVWDEVRTPYLTSVAKLDRRQADYEVYVYALFLGVFFAAVMLTAATDHLPAGRSTLVGTYAFTVVCGALIFGFTKHYWSALYCAATPIATGVYLLLNGFPPNLRGIDHMLISVALLVVLVYSWRIAAIGRLYPAMPEPSTPDPERRRSPWH